MSFYKDPQKKLNFGFFYKEILALFLCKLYFEQVNCEAKQSLFCFGPEGSTVQVALLLLQEPYGLPLLCFRPLQTTFKLCSGA